MFERLTAKVVSARKQDYADFRTQLRDLMRIIDDQEERETEALAANLIEES